MKPKLLFVAATILVGTLGLLTAGFAHSQAPGEAARPSWKVGDTWEYRNFQVNDGRVNRKWKETITAVSADKIKSRRVDSVDPPSETEATLEQFYPHPLTAGREWYTSRTIRGVMVKSINLARAWENISTAAGSFRAMRVESTFTRPEGSFRQLIWYAPTARRFVKLQFLDKQGNPYQETELMSFKLQ